MQYLPLLIRKSLDGSASAEELKELLRQLEQNELHLRDKWMQLSVSEIEDDAASVFDQDRIRLLLDKKIKTFPQFVIKPNTAVFRWLKVITTAAAILTGLLLTMNYLFRSSSKSGVKPVQTVAIAADWQTMEADGVNRCFTLPDGSEVLLYAGSKIHFSGNYNVSERNLHLLGKGRFTVRQNRDLPFVVYSKHVATTALGTVFEVWERCDSTSVRLLDGKVSVLNYAAVDPRLVYLKPGEQAVSYKDAPLAVKVYSEQEEKLAHGTSKESEKVGPYSGLTFRQMPLEKVFNVLQKKYKVAIAFEKQDVAGMMFTATFGEQDSLDAILRVITGMNNLELETSDKGFIVVK